MQTKRRWAPGHNARATHRAGALAGCIATLAVVLSVAACGHGSAVDPISVDADSAVVPRAVCGPGSSPETGLQGEVSRADRDSGRSARGYRCNLELVGQYQGEGASWVNPSTSHCAYLSTSFLGVLRKASPGVQVIDVSDPAAPKLATHLTSASMLVGP